jgi:hypothetical protein
MKSKSGREIVGYAVHANGGVRWKSCIYDATVSGRAARDEAAAHPAVLSPRKSIIVRREPKANASEAPKASPGPLVAPCGGCRPKHIVRPGESPFGASDFACSCSCHPDGLRTPGLDEAAEAARATYREGLSGAPVSSWADIDPEFQAQWRAVAEAVRHAWDLVPATERDSAIAEGIQLRGEVARLKEDLGRQRARLNTASAAIGHARRILPETV